jgi:hypothetical protein
MYPSLSKEDWQKIRHAEQKLRSKQAKKSWMQSAIVI